MRPMFGRMQTKTETSGPPARLALTREETAEALGMSAVSVDRLTRRGLLHPSRATRRPLFPVWEIERFLRDTSAVIGLRGAS